MKSPRAMHAGWAFVVVVAVGCVVTDPAPAAPAGTIALGGLPARSPVAVVVAADPAPAAPASADPQALLEGADAAPPVALVGAATAGAPAVRIAGDPLPAIDMVFTGDTLMHSPLVARAAANAGGAGYDFVPMLARIAPLIGAADLAVCHLETPVAPPGQALSTAPLYGVPAEVTTALAAVHYDRCSTASNHSLDRGIAGIDATVAALAAAGLGQSGMATDPAGSEPQVVDVDGARVSHLSYSYGFNGIPLPAGQPWRAGLIDPARIVADAATARARGAQLVIVSLHWGTEKVGAVTAEQRSVAEAITAGGLIDLVVGHHAHVLQPVEQVNGVWVVFGLGNLVSNLGAIAGWPAGAADGAIAEVRFVQQPDGRFVAATPVIEPTWVDIDAGWVVRPVLADLADPAVPDAVKAQLHASWDRTAAVLGPFLAAPA